MTEKIKNSPLRRIQVFFFAGELFTAVALCVGCYNLCHITRIRYGVSLPTDLLSTLVALWIIKSSLEALNSLRIGTIPSQNDSFDFVDDSQNDQLIDYHQSSCGNNTSKVAGDTQEEDEGVPTATVANIESDTLLQTKKILESEKAEIRDATTAKVHLPTLAFFATAFLQFAVRVFVIAQNLRRKLRIRETSRNNIIQISDVPFTIGKKMCTAGCPFFIFTFLNGLVRSGENDDLSDDNAGVFVDNNITFRAVSIEQICIGSSYGLVRSTREMESGDDPVVTQKMNQQSWLQLVFGGIEMCFIIHLKRKQRKDYAGGKTNAHEVGSHSDSGVHQIAISISIESIKFGVFPEFADSISLHGMEMNIDTTINTDASSPSLLGASDLHDEMCGAGMSASCHLLNLRRFQIVNSYNSSSSDDRPHSKVTSWSRLKSSFHIRRKISSKIAARQVIKSHAVASLSLPDGFVVTRQPKKQISETSYLKPTSVSFGNADEYYDGIFCNNLLAVGVDLKELRDLAEALEAVLLNIASSICPTLSSGVIGKGSFGSQSRKTKSKIEIVELSSNCCFRLSAILPPSHLKETKQRNRLSLNIPSALIQLKKNRFTEFQKDAISGLNKPYSNGKQGKADKSGNHSTECVIGAKSINMCFEVCGYDDLGKKHSSALELLAVHQISMKLTDLHEISPSRGLNDDELPTKSVTVNIGRAVVRLNGDVITQLAFANHFLESTKIGVRRLQCSVNQVKESISPTREEKSSVQGSSTKQNALDIVYVSCDCIDVAIDLPSGHKEIQVDKSNDDGRVRLALLQRSVEMNVSRCMEIQLSTFIDVDDMLESDLRSFGEYYFIKSAISKLEASVVFFPHSSLPTTEIYFSDACPPYPKNNETEFYGHASKVLMETFHPMKKSVGPPDSSSKVLAMKFCDLSAFERCAKKVRTEPSLFATSVYGFSFDHKRLRSGCNDWPMMERYAPASLTKIVQCNGSFCSVDKEDVAMGHKSSTIFIQVYETKTSELELFWSPILQWLQTSCNYRIQGSLSSIKSMVREETKDTGISHQKHSRILIRVDPSSRANMHVYFGSKSAMHTTFDGGLDMTVSMTKHMNDAARKAFVSPMKPNITLQAQHVTFLFNGIEEPVFEFDGVYFENTIRRAHDDEIAEYLEKTNRSIYTLSEFVATDHEGHPLKEIFELKFGSFAAMRFPPTLHFGEVIDDFVLTPRALDLGMNKLKGVEKKGPKKYQLMSINCDIPFLDVALLNDDNDSRRYLFGEDQSQLMDHQFLRDEFRLCFESVKLSVKRNTPPEIVQHQISALDEDLSSTFRYGPAIQGGELLLTIGHIVSTLRPLNIATPLLRINGLDMKGFLYLAGISPSTPGVTKGKHVTSALFCHHNCILVGENDCCCTYGISYYSAGIPVKLYTDCKVCCQQLEVSYGPVMNPSIPRFMECLQRILPPPPKSTGAPPTPLSWWDNLRFLVHGHMCLSLNTLSLRWLLDAYTFRDQSILFECEKCVIKHDIGTFDLNAADVNVSIPGTAYDMSCHPSKMDRTVISALLPSDADSIVGTHRHPLIYVPELKSKISFTWNMFAHGSRDSFHHSPYLIHYHKLDGSNCIEGDKFAPFRSDGVSVNFDFDLPGGDSCANWVALRIDVLPWFTHLNSTVDFSPADDKKPEPFPRFRSVAIKVIVNELKIATWFAENEDGDDEDTEELGGVCLIVNMVSYIATIEGSKEIKIEGPVKSALLDFCDLKTEAETEFDQLSKVELMAASFGSPMGNSNQVEHSNFGSKTCLVLDDKPLFMKLEELSREIDELDYLFITGQIDIQNKSLERILSGSDEIHRDSIDSANRKGLAVVDKSTWSILVSRLKLLWTLKIRDALMAITQDLIFTIGFMKSQIRQTQLLAESALTQHDFDGNSSNHRYSSPADSAGEGVELSLRDTLSTSSESAKSKLHYLLERDSGFEVNIANDGGHFVDRGKAEKTDLETVPTIDIHFSNPQVQLHSKTTGGSVILAMEGAHIEGRKFVKFLVTKPLNKTGKVFPRDLIRKTEHAYSLTNMEAFALSTHIDVNAGLPWLEICTPGDRNVTEAVILEERYGIADNISEFLTNAKSADIDSNSSRDDPVSICDNSSSDRSHHFIYPESLRHHEPLAFCKTGILRPILDKFTFQSRQVFHRPPVHYSTEELHSFINQGLVHTQNETAVDHIELQIDLLLFNLDSYQFKTTIDLIRNVLLEPPKPYRRHLQREKFDHIESQSNDPKPSNRISSVAATEMEDAIGKIASDDKHLGRKEREALRSSAMALQRDLEDRLTLSGDDITRRIVYTLNQLKWSIQCPDEIDDVEIAFTGFHGQHDYSANGSVLSQFGLEDVRVSSSKPGPDSICFLDPTSVVKSVLGDERTPCQRCGKKFDHDEDHSNPCQYHPGTFKSQIWTCCESADAHSLGCKSGPHTGKERAAMVRVQALPRSVEGITLYSHFEVNIFPSVPHTLVLQISKSLSRLFMAYFFVGNDGKEDVETMSTISEGTGSTEGASMYPENTPKQPVRRSLIVGGKPSPPSGGKSIRGEPYQNRTNDYENPSDIEETEKLVEGAEIIFIKVWRVGYVNVNLSLGGFRRLPQTTLDICVPAYSRAYEVGTWSYLGRKFLTFLIKEILKSGASSGLEKVRKKMIRSTTNPDCDHGKPFVEARSSPLASTDYTYLPEDEDFFLRKNLSRPVGAEAILGTPHRGKPKKKRPFGKK